MALQPYDLQSEKQTTHPFNAALNKLVAQALAEKSLTWFSAAGSLGLWTYAILNPDPYRLGAAAGYSVLCHLLPLFKRN